MRHRSRPSKRRGGWSARRSGCGGEGLEVPRRCLRTKPGLKPAAPKSELQPRTPAPAKSFQCRYPTVHTACKSVVSFRSEDYGRQAYVVVVALTTWRFMMKGILLVVPDAIKQKLDQKRMAGFTLNGFINSLLARELADPPKTRTPRRKTKP